MKKVAFYADHLTERGTAVAIFDYANGNQDILNNGSLIVYNKGAKVNDSGVVEKFKKHFEVLPCDGFVDADRIISSERCDLVYSIKSGGRDGQNSKIVPTMVHAVFPHSLKEVHGSSYAYVSEWLSDVCSQGKVPWVPHVVSIGTHEENWRGELGIPEESLVFGCYGGSESFDIGFVRETVIPRVLENQKNVWFIFMNIKPFLSHPRVRFLPKNIDMDDKTAFINTCDAMLHARRRGETFGLAVAEFSLRSKPILTFAQSREQAHLTTLGSTAIKYKNADELYAAISEFDLASPSARTVYQNSFNPNAVMKRFDDFLLQPALRFGIDGARQGLRLKAFEPANLAWVYFKTKNKFRPR